MYTLNTADTSDLNYFELFGTFVVMNALMFNQPHSANPWNDISTHVSVTKWRERQTFLLMIDRPSFLLKRGFKFYVWTTIRYRASLIIHQINTCNYLISFFLFLSKTCLADFNDLLSKDCLKFWTRWITLDFSFPAVF